MSDEENNSRRSILITGASSGFGLGTAVELARRGWQVFAGFRDPGRRTSLDAALVAAGLPPSAVEIVALDVTSAESIAGAATTVLARATEGVDVVLHNAGYTTAGFFEDLTDEDCRRLMETSFFGTLALTRELLPSMRARRRGRIAVVTSNAVNVPHPLFSVYAAAKWALEGWAEALSLELAPFGIDVVVLQPGAHRTSFESNVMPVVEEGSPYGSLFEAAAPRLAWIGRHQRDPDKAVAAIVRAIESKRPPFRVYIGADDRIAAMLKGVAPYRLRERVVGRITGLRAAGPRRASHL